MQYIKLIGIFLLLLVVIKCLNSPEIPLNPTAGEKSHSGAYIKSEDEKWYSGGNLHKKNIRAWKNASDADKLATCADFIAGVKKDLPLTELKEEASQLKVFQVR